MYERGFQVLLADAIIYMIDRMQKLIDERRAIGFQSSFGPFG